MIGLNRGKKAKKKDDTTKKALVIGTALALLKGAASTGAGLVTKAVASKAGMAMALNRKMSARQLRTFRKRVKQLDLARRKLYNALEISKVAPPAVWLKRLGVIKKQVRDIARIEGGLGIKRNPTVPVAKRPLSAAARKARQAAVRKAMSANRFSRTRIASPKEFDPRSFRTVSPGTGRHKMVVACPKGQFKGGKCKVGMEVQSVMKRIFSNPRIKWVPFGRGYLYAVESSGGRYPSWHWAVRRTNTLRGQASSGGSGADTKAGAVAWARDHIIREMANEKRRKMWERKHGPTFGKNWTPKQHSRAWEGARDKMERAKTPQAFAFAAGQASAHDDAQKKFSKNAPKRYHQKQRHAWTKKADKVEWTGDKYTTGYYRGMAAAHKLSARHPAARNPLLMVVPNPKQRDYEWVSVWSGENTQEIKFWRDILKAGGVRAQMSDRTPYEGHKALEVFGADIGKALRIANKQEGVRSRLSGAIRYSAATQGYKAQLRKRNYHRNPGAKFHALHRDMFKLKARDALRAGRRDSYERADARMTAHEHSLQASKSPAARRAMVEAAKADIRALQMTGVNPGDPTPIKVLAGPFKDRKEAAAERDHQIRLGQKGLVKVVSVPGAGLFYVICQRSKWERPGKNPGPVWHKEQLKKAERLYDDYIEGDELAAEGAAGEIRAHKASLAALKRGVTKNPGYVLAPRVCALRTIAASGQAGVVDGRKVDPTIAGALLKFLAAQSADNAARLAKDDVGLLIQYAYKNARRR